MKTVIPSRHAHRHLVAAACAAALACVCLAACGDASTDLPPGVVAEVGHTPITRATLDHEMIATLGGDYHYVTSRAAPTALLAGPPDHASCVTELERIVADPEAKKLTAAQIKKLCGELYDAIEEQALTYLISAQSTLAEAARYGVTVSNAEVEREFERMRAKRFPTEAELHAYLTQRHLTLADELLETKLEALSAKTLYAEAEQDGGDAKAIHAAYTGREAKLVSETNCRPGYVVARCRQYPYYVPGKIERIYRGAPPAQLLFEIGRLEPATSHGFTKRAKSATEHVGTSTTECHIVGKLLDCATPKKTR